MNNKLQHSNELKVDQKKHILYANHIFASTI